MGKFIEVHQFKRDSDGNRIALPLLVNLDHVEDVADTVKSCRIIYADGDSLTPVESYEQVRRLIGAATGGIPIADLDEHIRGMD